MGSRSGQAIVEYILVLAIAVTGISLLVKGLEGTIVRTWKAWNNEISAACPQCKPPDLPNR